MKNILVRIFLGLIFIIALMLRVFSVINQDESKKTLFADAKQYDNIAVNILSGYGFSQHITGERVATASRMPIYPFFLAGIYAVFGHNYMAARIAQALLGALMCIIIFFVADILYENKPIGITAAFMAAIYKPFISGFNYYGGPTSLISEYLYMFIVCLAIFNIVFFLKKENHIRAVFAGICVGLAILTRAEFVFYPVVLFFYLLSICKWSVKNFLKRFFVFYLLIMLTLIPWVIRNYIVYKKIIPLATYHGGIAFWTGNCSLASGGWAYPLDYKETMKKVENLGEYEQNKEFFKKGMEELKRKPGRILFLYMRKILVHWAPFESGFKLFNIYYAGVLLLAAIGILFFRKHNIKEGVLLSIFFATSLSAIIIYGDPRYRYPYEPYLIIFAALEANKIFNKNSGNE